MHNGTRLQPPIVAFIVLGQTCDSKAKERGFVTLWDGTLALTEFSQKRSSDLFKIYYFQLD